MRSLTLIVWTTIFLGGPAGGSALALDVSLPGNSLCQAPVQTDVTFPQPVPSPVVEKGDLAPSRPSLKSPEQAKEELPGQSVQKQTAQKSGAGSKRKYRGTPPCLAWIDQEREPRAVLLCVHGCGLHNGTFEAFGKAMSARGIATYAVDVRGFGSWQESRGHEKVDFDGCLSDVVETLKVLHRAHPRLPVYLLGESMGGAIALRVSSEHPDLVSGLISAVPAGDRFKQTSTDLKVAVRYLLGPNRRFDIGTAIINQATEKPELRKSWAEDPLARMNLSPNELLQFHLFEDGNKKAASGITDMPVLMVQGTGDKLIKPEGTFEIFDQLATKDKQLIAVQGAEHLIFEENQFSDPVIDILVGWIDRVPPKHLIEGGESAVKSYLEELRQQGKRTCKPKATGDNSPAAANAGHQATETGKDDGLAASAAADESAANAAADEAAANAAADAAAQAASAATAGRIVEGSARPQAAKPGQNPPGGANIYQGGDAAARRAAQDAARWAAQDAAAAAAADAAAAEAARRMGVSGAGN